MRPTAPPHQDFDLHKYGLKLMYGEVERCYLFEDGTTLTTYTDDPHRTYKQFKNVIGKADTDTLEEIFYRYLVKVEEEFYASPKPNEERGGGLSDSVRREYQRHCAMSGRDLLNDLYQSDKLKTFIAVNACVRGNTDFYPGVGDFFLRYSASPGLSIIRGGTSQLAHSLAAFFHANGGIILNACHVEKINVEGGRATGVELSDGRKFTATKFVASEVDPPATFLRMVGEEHLPDIIVERCENWVVK